jgi:TonB-linked SusC/RagA family outer membrane protein
LAALAMVATAAKAQTGTVTGQITSTDGQPLSGAQVVVEGTTLGVISNQAGRFLFTNSPAGEQRITVVIIGFVSQTRTVTVRSTQPTEVDFVLEVSALRLDELVVTATGSQRRREIGNSIAKVEAAEVAEVAPMTSFQELLQGRAAGVSVLPSSGTVGSGSRIRIRGISSATLSADPLVYVDGIRVSAESPDLDGSVGVGGGEPSLFNDLNPEEIESMEIVKGPSAATLYGTQAANGVILITTKRGREGPARWSVYTEQGITQDPADYPGIFFSQGTDGTGATVRCLPLDQAAGSCTITELFSRNLLTEPEYSPIRNGRRQQYGIQVSGGSGVRYFVAAELENEIGTLQMPQVSRDFLKTERGTTEIPEDELTPNESSKANLRVNLTADLSERLELNVSTGLIRSTLRLPQTGDNLESILGSALFGDADPDAPDVFGFFPQDQNFARHVWRETDRFVNSSNVRWNPTDYLSAHATVGLDYTGYDNEALNAPGQGAGANRLGLRAIDAYTSYKHSVDVGASALFGLTDRIGSRTAIGTQFNVDKLEATLNSASVFPPGGSTLDAGATKESAELTLESRTLGSYVEQQVSLDDRLFVTGAIRVDENSAFGEGFEAAWYPKASASFMVFDQRDDRWVSSLRVRGAYGQSGLQPDPNAALRYLLPVTSSVLVGGEAVDVPSVTLGGLGNLGLRPERSAEYEIGFDATGLDDRVDLDFTFYSKRTTDALLERELPGSLGGTPIRFENLGEVTNKGVEVSVQARVWESDGMEWSVGLTGSRNTNELVSLGEGVPPIQGFGYAQKPGYPLYGMWWPGLESWDDANADGVIDFSEVVVSDTAVFGGSTVPTKSLQLNTDVTLWGGRLQIGGLLDYQGGFVSHNVNSLFQCGFIQNCQALNDPNTPLEDQARAVAGSMGAFGAYVEDGTFIKMREAHVGVTLPQEWAARLGARTATVVLTGRNLFTITDFSSWDPEINTQGSTDGPNYNFVQSGQLRTFLVRVNLGY